MKPFNKKEMPFLSHIGALRKHILRSLVGILMGSAFILFNKEIIVDKIIFSPSKTDFITYKVIKKLDFSLIGEKNLALLQDLKIQNRYLLGQFNLYVLICLIGGIVLSFPYLIYEIWSFIAPGLSNKEKSYTKGILMASSFLFFLGILFGYFILFPFIIQFGYNFKLSEIPENIFDLSGYISIFIQSTLSMGIIFLFPIAIYFLTKIGLVGYQSLKTYRKHAFFIIFVISSIFTPSDLLSTILVAIPLYVLYEISILSSFIIEKKAKSKKI